MQDNKETQFDDVHHQWMLHAALAHDQVTLERLLVSATPETRKRWYQAAHLILHACRIHFSTQMRFTWNALKDTWNAIMNKSGDQK